MPGIFGAVGFDANFNEKLQSAFATPWGSCESTMLPNGILGGHAFPPAQALNRTYNGIQFAVDGEASIYQAASEFSLRREPTIFQISSSNEITLATSCKGNVAAVEPKSGVWYLAAEWTGSFPLYYSHTPGQLLFCSRLKPLARLLDSSPDLIAIREFLHENYMPAARSFFNGISRLMPGQTLAFDPHRDRIYLRETSEAWTAVEEDHLNDPKRAANVSWHNLMNATQLCLDNSIQHAMMISGGWDSRTLLAATAQTLNPDKLIGYTHGDLQSRELQIAEGICRSSGIRLHKEALNNAMLDPELLQRGFDRVETVLYPPWHRAGQVLVDLGVKCVSAGIYGEVIGGHYGRTMLAQGARKIPLLAAQLFGWFHHSDSSTYADAFDFLRIRHLGRPWHVEESFWNNIDLLDAVNADIQGTLIRLRERGISRGSQLLEAFITEHRGAQCINAQLLSCRASLDISIPFADRDFFTLASRIPIRAKIHNTVSREMLKSQGSHLLRLATPATLVPAAWPIWLQETSRLMRYIGDNAFWNFHLATHGRIRSPRTTWWNWEFLRNGASLNTLVADLRCDFWNKRSMRNRIKDLAYIFHKREPQNTINTLLDCIIKDYNVDLMLR
jgi:hypothetical protein